MWMWTTKEILLFFAGAEAFHTLSHVFFALSGMLPIRFWGITWTQQSNIIAIVVNAAVTAGLLWWAFNRTI